MTTPLEDFKNYVISEYANDDVVKNYKVAHFKYFHTNKSKEVKLTKKMIKDGVTEKPSNVNVDIVRISIKFIDDNLEALLSKSISFENNELSTACKNSLKNITADELQTKYIKALPMIIQTIQDDYTSIIHEYNTKLQQLSSFEHSQQRSQENSSTEHSSKKHSKKKDKEVILEEPVKKEVFDM